MDGVKIGLGIWDYVMFSLMLIISAAIGVYFRFRGNKQKTTDEYLLAGKDMPILPVAFSIMASFMSATAIIGTPMEVYYFGIQMAYTCVSYIIGMTISAYTTLPVYFEMGASTIYEYAERRFGKHTRTLTSSSFILQMILFMSVVLYAPALALSAVTNMSMWVSIVSVGVVCTFYCTIGGMKAVLWTDVFQSFLMFFGVIAILIKGCIDVGIGNAIQIAKDGGRIALPSFDLSFYKRYTAWNILIQGVIVAVSLFSANQIQVQRLLTLKNIKRSRWALFSSYPISIALYLMICFVGVVLYAYFSKCDPLSPPNNPIYKGDQLLPYFMMISLENYPGLAGICICGIFSASLSTVSSCVNSLTVVTMQDLIRPFVLSKNLSEIKLSIIAQLITFFYGLLCIALTFVFASVGSLVQLSVTVFGCLGGPVLAVFLLGMFTTRSNEKGVIIGFLIGMGISSWIGFGIVAYSTKHDALPVSIEGCPKVNSSIMINFLNATEYADSSNSHANYIAGFENKTDIKVENDNTEYIFPLYRISFMWTVAVGFFLTYIIGYFSSIIINIVNGETKEVSPELISPIMKCFCNRNSSSSKSKTNMKKDLNEMKVVR
ncbi:putative sodium-dependent multivitamin transporter isoform X1 [Parasteatoda tepidariorum]|uniref:putative sodium-dependent multivitamin transporter isoform X1 n=1 Tax=Parasteatoda tepidariorum TaxID=114398 RepID=UPI00077FC0FD|nr:putative sodium-dependent multivitamin transporter isoform X1 [Parasteatoda tepidariorum]XP_015913590.1 putative sodium-dependent multivitamin transporter isoform X1 [Parasteatoda tepidariorum]XP_015913591.1 putative sodium-dependent multivitamin transporter isoform X1 [Parasteatoda tepidariorum]XP_015913592.1 putative sodium-dependent multivitamin transporter isoform X1 [Parasteatoda tepidariorum]